ncbi:tetraacyldisaccharide 4'-kinase [Chitinimonas viridis]|uniref:Tetraacyldisaccharide 4'-kinase n=1 Tax=Chitinimonas viridis TaxID=664880 RepID=A0ABT8B8J6_9NEIS|nr:tetraacyldisaccharide 4'-kinase [Chitinimonas viridis]MDN3577829.1 tetraacyldisaccharide 4'-kinase [Chitinimonas viridis]
MQTPRYWQSRFPAALLLPVSALFGGLAALRRQLYRLGLLQTHTLPCLLVVVGNITAGGAGKTPTVHYLARQLRARGWQPGIISRGYGGQITDVAEVPADGDASRYGDEPLLLARSTGCPVFVGRDRIAAAQALLAAHPTTTVLLCDDGLQHYRLGRDIEIVVVDGNRGLQNGWLLPAGPLREPASRLAQAQAMLVNGSGAPGLPAHPQRFDMALQPGPAWQLAQPDQRQPLSNFANRQVAALAGIGHPERFFTTLRAAGLTVQPHPFPDHHRYSVADLNQVQADIRLVTEKDAVKLIALLSEEGLAHSGNIWVVPVEAAIEPDLADWLTSRLNALKSKDGRQTA